MSEKIFDKFETIVYKDDLKAFTSELENVDINIQNKYGWTLLHICVRRDRRDMVELLVNKGADINMIDGVGWTPLMEAIMDDMTELCKYLLDKGANPEIKNQRGATAFMLVQKFDRKSMMSFF